MLIFRLLIMFLKVSFTIKIAIASVKTFFFFHKSIGSFVIIYQIWKIIIIVKISRKLNFHFKTIKFLLQFAFENEFKVEIIVWKFIRLENNNEKQNWKLLFWKWNKDIRNEKYLISPENQHFFTFYLFFFSNLNKNIIIAKYH